MQSLVRLLGVILCLLLPTLTWAQPPEGPPSAMQRPDVHPPLPSTQGGGGRAPVQSSVRVAVPGNVFSSLIKGKPVGVILETTNTILKNAGMIPTNVTMSTADALKDVKDGKIGLATVVVVTDRIQGAAYFSDPIITEYNVVAARKGQGFDLTSTKDLHGKKIGTRVGYQYPMLDKDPEIQLVRFKSDGEMLRSLFFGEVDVVIISAVSDVFEFRAEGIMTRLNVLKTAVGSVPLVLAFSKQHFSQEAVSEFNKSLAEFKRGSAWRAMLERNGLEDLVVEWPLVAH